jgi:hypothetical protein
MIVALIFGVFIVVSWADWGFRVSLIMIILLYLAFVRKLLCLAIYNQLTVTDEGLDFRRIGYRIRTTWGNIERMTYAQFGYAQGDILVLREPQVSVHKRLAVLWNEGRLLERNKEFAPLGKTIPLFLLDPKWRTGKLGQEVRCYAPHLFEEYEK